MSKLSKSEFERTVYSVAGDMPQVLNVTINGFRVDITFESNSRKTHWDAYLNFDEVTGNYTYTPLYRGVSPTLPWVFGNEISSRIKEILNN